MIPAWLSAQALGAVTFVVFVVMTIGGALLATTTGRLIRSVCGLAVCYFGLAGLFYFLNSPFVALMVILIYIGAVCVTIVFGIMLAAGGHDQPTVAARSLLTAASVAAAGALTWALLRLNAVTVWPAPAEPVGAGTVADIGRAFLTTHSMVFELISLVLLVAILGALVVARAGRGRA